MLEDDTACLVIRTFSQKDIAERNSYYLENLSTLYIFLSSRLEDVLFLYKPKTENFSQDTLFSEKEIKSSTLHI